MIWRFRHDQSLRLCGGIRLVDNDKSKAAFPYNEWPAEALFLYNSAGAPEPHVAA
jgi:hypothetical protein